MALPTTNITTTLVAQAIGLASNNVGSLCTYSGVNKWSKYGPVNYPLLPRTNRHDFSRWKLASDIYGVNYFVPNPPTGGTNSPYCLGDFRGYEHSNTLAAPFSLSLNTFNTAGQTNLSSYITTGTGPANFTLNIYLPQVVDNSLPAISGYKNNITVSLDYRLNEGGASYVTIKTQSFSYSENSGTTISLDCSQTTNLPSIAGGTTLPKYYVAINGAYFSGFTQYVAGKIYRQFIDDITNPAGNNLYDNVDPAYLSYANGASSGNVLYDSFKYYYGNSTYPDNVFYLYNFHHTIQPGVYIEFSQDGVNFTRYNFKFLASTTYSNTYIVTGAGLNTYWRFYSAAIEG